MSKDGSPDSNGRHASPPTKIDKLRYAGYSAEFLDRVEPNGNIPDRCAPGNYAMQKFGQVIKPCRGLVRNCATQKSGSGTHATRRFGSGNYAMQKFDLGNFFLAEIWFR
jgi:hypothetical protein